VCIFVIYIEFFPYCLFVSNSQVIGCEDRLRNDLYYVGWGVKLYSIQSIQCYISVFWLLLLIKFLCVRAAFHKVLVSMCFNDNFECFAHWTVQSVKEDGDDFNSTEILVSEPKKVGDGMSAYIIYKVTTRVKNASANS